MRVRVAGEVIGTNGTSEIWTIRLVRFTATKQDSRHSRVPASALALLLSDSQQLTFTDQVQIVHNFSSTTHHKAEGPWMTVLVKLVVTFQ